MSPTDATDTAMVADSTPQATHHIPGPHPAVTINDFLAAGFDRRDHKKFQAAIDFHQREGHLRAPSRNRENGVHLRRYLTRLRAAHRNGKLSDAQINVCDRLDMVWDARVLGHREVLTDEQRADLARQYKAGRSIRELAAVSGRAYATVREILIVEGVTLRSHGGGEKVRRAQREQNADFVDAAATPP